MAPSTNVHKTGQTRYRAIEEYLRSLVEGAGPGDPLPSEAELCERFSVSRMTVRQALQELTNDGLVERRRGQGTFVAHRPVHRHPGVFLSFTEEMNRRGVQATSRLLSAGMDDPRRPETLDLGLAPDSQVVRVSKAEMLRVLHAEPSFAELFMTHLLTRNSRVEEDLVDQLFNSSEKRLARTLLLLANVGKDGGPQPITTPISQETLAEIIGTTRSRVSGFMNKFRKLGFIEYNGHLEVHSSLLSVLLRE